MRRAIRAHSLRTVRLFPPPPPSQSLSFTAPPLLKLTKLLSLSHPFSLPKALTSIKLVPAAPFSASPICALTTHQKIFGSFVSRCISSSLNSAHTLEWNEPVSCSEVVGDVDVSGVDAEEDPRPSIPVRAYIFSTRSVLGFRFLSVDPAGLLRSQEFLTFLNRLLFSRSIFSNRYIAA